MEGNGSSTAAVVPDPPRWALAEGVLDQPGDGSFRAYWLRQGFSRRDIARAFEDLAVPDMANLRLGHELRMRHPERFDMHVCSRLLAARGMFHHD